MTEQPGSRTGTTWYESTPSWPDADAMSPPRPNVVVVLLDDVGFSQLGCYGSDIATPAIDRLARHGLRYSNFTTTALCSPTRASLLTGRNHHRVGMASIAELVNGFPNSRGRGGGAGEGRGGGRGGGEGAAGGRRGAGGGGAGGQRAAGAGLRTVLRVP